MELTQKMFAERLANLRQLSLESPEEFERLRCRLHEKGVECAIIIPFLEIVLEFDALLDVTYEQASDVKHGQRFDFLLGDSFLVQTKALAAELNEHHKQIERYIRGNDNINYGLLTNGVDYQIWLQRSYIETIAKAPLPHAAPVAKVLELSLDKDSVDFVLDVLGLFRKDRYAHSFETVASVAGYYGAGGLGKPKILHDDKKTNEELRDRIKEAVSVRKGVYYKDVTEGRLAAGDKLRYKDDCVEITVEVTETGTVILKKGCANVIDMVKAMREGWGAMIGLIAEKWAQADSEFEDPLEIIKRAQDKQKLYGKEKYKFEPVR